MAYLFVLNGAARYRAFPLADGSVTIGKGEGVDIRLSDTWVSGRHARLHKQGARFQLEDLGSTNGTFVNLDRLAPEAPRDLADDDVIFLGGTHLLIVTADRLPSAPPRPARPAAPPDGAAEQRMWRRPDEIDVSPLALGDDGDDARRPGASASADAAATAFLDPALLDSVDLDSLDGEAVDQDAFRAPPPTAAELEELERVLLAPRPVRARPPAATKAIGAAPFVDEGTTDGSDPSDTGPLRAVSGSLEIDLDELLGDSAASAAPPARSAAGGVSSASRGGREGRGAPAPAPAAGPDPAGAADAAGAAAAHDPRDRELARLRGLLAAREAEIARLREENLRLKERYLDL